ncbi:ATP-grasp domain-containing protein [Poritiphilus flavus]|uniref:ATP-grasp domain-containing protein n=1 Tax=Poritiphilus flavus TaxID=2697053 RepID=A0A6L9E9W1_9FLAO|nr:ATP-grasp domain-containing protein [Poritiphilus flavus]NAS11328.1 ATP-grasp domain-containing protein [Poritiphilus flavus]
MDKLKNTLEGGIAVIHQAKPPPPKDGIQKPMKPTGYADSGADILYALRERGYPVITPEKNPGITKDRDWVFPDTTAGIKQAIENGARIIWLNTILFDTHPITDFFGKNLQFVGQTPGMTDLYDDKLLTNDLLREHGLPVPETVLMNKKNLLEKSYPLPLPAVLKPIRGRGSQGVVVVEKPHKLEMELKRMLEEGSYGNTLYLEPYLSGQEITFTVMPAGSYFINGELREFKAAWSLPAVKRFNHHQGVAPYNGTVAVTLNSAVLSDEELQEERVVKASHQCEVAASLVSARAPIRIDCRADAKGDYWLFDLNVKPNMTGASRPHRQDQDSLSALAARKIGWEFADLLENMLRQRWQL